jgi:hypothetical protein
MSRVVLVAIGSVVLSGCEARDPDIIETREHIRYSRSAYERGRRDAEAGIHAGRLVLEDYGAFREKARRSSQTYSDSVTASSYGEWMMTSSRTLPLVTREATTRSLMPRSSGDSAPVLFRMLRERPRSITMRSTHNRPNHAMESTASRRTIQLLMSSTRQSAATRVLARGGSSCSR